MTICHECGRDKPGGAVVSTPEGAYFVCGSCEPSVAAASRRNWRRNPGARGRA